MKLIAPNGAITDASEDTVELLLKAGFKKPQSHKKPVKQAKKESEKQ